MNTHTCLIERDAIFVDIAFTLSIDPAVRLNVYGFAFVFILWTLNSADGEMLSPSDFVTINGINTSLLSTELPN